MSDFAESLVGAFERQKHLLFGQGLEKVAKARHAALESAARLGLPTFRDEHWKYTSLGKLDSEDRFTVAEQNTNDNLLEALADLIPSFAESRIVFLDGYFVEQLSNLSTLDTGVVFRQFSELLNNDHEEALKYLTNDSLSDNVFAQLNSSFVQDGALLEIQANVNAKPIEVVFADSGTAKFTSPRLVVHAAPNSRSEIIETHLSAKQSNCLTNALTEIFAEPTANVDHYRLQFDQSAHHIGHVELHIKKDAKVSTLSIALGGDLTRIDVNAYLRESGGHVAMNGLFIANGHQHIDHHTRINHLAPHTTSDENFKGIANDNGRGVFNGKIYVQEHAQKIVATQSSKNLLLSDDAEIDTKPELEIYADDVQCAHGATVGQLREDEFFYLRSRGIEATIARAMLTIAFADDILAGIENDPLKTYIEDRVSAALAQ